MQWEANSCRSITACIWWQGKLAQAKGKGKKAQERFRNNPAMEGRKKKAGKGDRGRWKELCNVVVPNHIALLRHTRAHSNVNCEASTLHACVTQAP